MLMPFISAFLALALLYGLEFLFHIKDRLKEKLKKYYFCGALVIGIAFLLMCRLIFKKNSSVSTALFIAAITYLLVPFPRDKK